MRSYLKNNKTLLAALVLLVLCVAILAHGKVFLRWGSATDAPEAFIRIGGVPAYSTQVAINNGKGTLSVFFFKKYLSDIVPILGRVLGNCKITTSGSGMAIGSATLDGKPVRIVGAELNKGTLVFALQASDTSGKALRPPERNLMKGITAYPQSTPEFYARDERTGIGLGSFLSTADPDTIQKYFKGSLTADGWSESFPVRGRNAMPVYLRNQEFCCVHVTDDGISGQSKIVLVRGIQPD